MSRIRLITVCGIGETPGSDMLGGLRRVLPEFEHVLINWKASYGPVNPQRNPWGASFMASMADGIAKVRAALDTGGPAVLAGYSGGAGVAGHVAAHGHPNLIAVGMVADPFAPGSGIAGSRPVTAVPARWESNPRDVICCCPDDSPLRTIADVSPAFSLADPAMWTHHLVTQMRKGAIAAPIRNPLHPLYEVRRFQRAAEDAAGYLGLDVRTLKFSGSLCQHTAYSWHRPYRGGTTTYLEELAWWLRSRVASDPSR
ncbi:lysin B [Gordonia phage Clown]|uniref:Lysin B n=1 Tax=Gordonia phage Clown TaxID=2759393 RepID=A0A7L7SLJ6_9CAUD|nr:lysin B [Gordonia phage Clown]QOC56048.1 lysin B [Gordonia phage Clown]